MIQIPRLRRTGCGLLLVLLGLRPAAASAQDTRLTDRLPAATATAVGALVDSAAHATLPTEPLILKALEGQSKGADSARIVTAVRALMTNLGTARDALGTTASESDLVAGAAALRAGAQATSLTTLRALRGRRSLGVALSVYADLLTSGLAADRAWQEVRDLAERRAADSEFLELRDRTTGRGRPEGRELPPPVRSDGPEHSSP
jgi:hypothetical protein